MDKEYLKPSFDQIMHRHDCREYPDEQSYIDVDELISLVRGNAWQPIETAPKEQIILAYHVNWGAMAVQNKLVEIEGEKFPWVSAGYGQCWPNEAFTHWMPLPPEPSQ